MPCRVELNAACQVFAPGTNNDVFLHRRRNMALHQRNENPTSEMQCSVLIGGPVRTQSGPMISGHVKCVCVRACVCVRVCVVCVCVCVCFGRTLLL